MKISRFNYINLAIFFVVIITMAIVFYKVEREATLGYIADRTNQDIYRLEIDIQKYLQDNKSENIQSSLDQYSAIDPIIKRLSLSLDAKTIYISSSRSYSSKLVGNDYLDVKYMQQAIENNNHTKFSVEIEYFTQDTKKIAYLYIDLNEKYLYERLVKIAFLYGGLLLVTLFIASIFVLNIVRWIIVDPIKEITAKISLPHPVHTPYYVDELQKLDEILCDSIDTTAKQSYELQLVLDEVVYLDNILQTVADINHLLLTSADAAVLLDKSCARLVDQTGYELCFISLLDEQSLMVEATSKEIDGFVHKKMKLCELTDCFINQSIMQNCIKMIDLKVDSLPYKEYDDIAKSMGFNIGVSIPIISDIYNKPIGAMVLYTKHDEFKQKELDMLEELSGDIGFAIKSFRHQEELRKNLFTDSITKLPNRFSLTQRLEDKKLYALAVINIDRFSEINEVYGINMGDTVLEQYAIWLEEKLSRYGGTELYKLTSDEFVVLMENCTDIDIFVEIISYLIEETKYATFEIDNIEVILSITAGVAHLDERVLEYAVFALKTAKSRQHSLEVYTSEFKKDQSNNIIWYKKIKDAIADSRIIPYFQPIVSNIDNSIIKYEALVRLIDTDGKVISPFFFLDIAKKTKLYTEITKIVVDKTIELVSGKNIKVSINLSTQDLINSELSDYIESVISKHNMGKFIEFEILESEGIENYSSVMEFVARFKDLGCSFAIDDFGSGYSNFEHLLKLNIDTLKIDASLIRNLPHDKNAQIFVRHICEFAHEINIFVIAEFVSSAEILERVKKIGIDASQGFYFYEPSPHIVN